MLPDWIKKSSFYLLFVVLLIAPLWRGGYFPEQKWYLAVGLLAAGAVELAVAIAGGRWRAAWSPGFLLLALFAGYAVTTRAWSATPEITNRESMLMLGYLAVYFVVRAQLLRYGMSALESIAAWFVYTASFTAGWGLIAFIWRWEPYTGLVDNVYRAGSTFEYSNALSCFCLMALPVTVAIMRQPGSRDRPELAAAVCLQAAAVIVSYARFGIIALALLSIYLVITGRRGGFMLSTAISLAASVPIAIVATMAAEANMPSIGTVVAMVILVAVWSIERGMDNPVFRRTLRIVAAMVAAAGLVIAAVLAAASERMREIINIRFEEGMSLSSLLPHRLGTWQGTVDALKVRPVTGSGLGSFATVYSEHAIAVYTKYAHNLILQMAVDTGIIGAALLVLFLVYVAVLSLKWLIVKTNSVAGALAISCLIFIIYNMFDWEWYLPAITAWFVVAAACVEKIPDVDERG